MWPGITYEACAWERDPDELALIPKSRRRKILPTYEAAVPASIASLPVEIPSPLAQRLAEVEVSLARFDTAQEARGYSLPALLLRSESSPSSAARRRPTRCSSRATLPRCEKRLGRAARST